MPTTPTDVPTVQSPVNPTPAPEQVVVTLPVAPSTMDKAKTYAKLAFKKVGLPVLIGATAAYVATRNSGKSDDELETEYVDAIDGEIVTEQ